MMRYSSLFISILAICLLLTVAAIAIQPVATSIAQRHSEASTMTNTSLQQPQQNAVKPGQPVYSKSGYDITPYSKAKVAELAKKLSPDQFRITQNAGTEPAFCGNLVDNHKNGIYTCIVCGLPLFRSDDKFTSGTGWPSFFQPFDPAHIRELQDDSVGMVRTEIRCARCGAHLGHVFDDGPKPTGLRFCVNSASLTFIEKGDPLPPQSQPVKTETAYFAGGCFWGIEHYMQEGPGVIDAISGYMGGHTVDPTYRQVCTDKTGYAETVKVVFDPARISYDRLLEAFFAMHNPTELNRQGPDVGTQYRSAIFTTSDEQMKEATACIVKLTAQHAYDGRKIVTTVEKAPEFYKAEDYHQDYIDKTGHACSATNPW